MIFNPGIPFFPKKIPFFYGWIILGLGTLGIIMSIPGQTIGVSVFTDYLIDALGIDRIRLSLAYLLGTFGSAFIISYAGKLYDRLGARAIGTITSVALGALLLILSQIQNILGFLTQTFSAISSEWIAFTLITLGFFGLRFLGQGVLTMVSRNMVMKWFEDHRGFANAILGTATAFGFSYAPRLLINLIRQFKWDGTWNVLGWIIGIGFTLIFYLLSRDNPEECGLIPDGNQFHKKKHKAIKTHPVTNFSVKEAKRTFSFWIFTLILSMFALFITGLTFHIVSIFKEAGMDQNAAVSIFLPAAIISVILNFAVSWISDYIKLKYILLLEALGLMICMCALVFLAPGWPVLLLIIGNGINGGAFGILSTVVWPRFYGTNHLGSISGYAMGWLVAGSALGPTLLSLSLRYTQTYATAGIVCLGLTFVLFILGFRAEQPLHPSKQAGDADPK